MCSHCRVNLSDRVKSQYILTNLPPKDPIAYFLLELAVFANLKVRDCFAPLAKGLPRRCEVTEEIKRT